MQRVVSWLVSPVSGALLVLISLLPSCSHEGIMTGTSTLPAAVPRDSTPAYVQYGIASWYGQEFHGRRTANGEVFNMFQQTAAHQSAPLGVHAIVTNLDTGRAVRVRINDRGPFVHGRILDLSYAAARQLRMLETGLARVKIQFLPETVPIPTFVVQAGAYGDAHNAARVRDMLSAQYPRVWITEAREGDQTLYRVRLGTFLDRFAAEQVADRIQALGVATQVLPLAEPAAPFRPSADRL